MSSSRGSEVVEGVGAEVRLVMSGGRVEEVVDDLLGQPGIDHRRSGVHGAHGVGERVWLGAFQEEGAGSGAQGPECVLVQVEGGEHDDLGVGCILGDDPGRLEAAYAWYANVHEYNVRAVRPGEGDCLLTGCGLRDDVDVVGGVEDEGVAGAFQRLVVGDQNSDRGVVGAHAPLPSLRGIVTRVCQPPPARGPALAVPPNAAARSRMPVRPRPAPTEGRPGCGWPSSVMVTSMFVGVDSAPSRDLNQIER